MVSFSGGKDSSLLLTVAVGLARREGLPLPVPVTWRFSGAPRAEESAWQDDIIRLLRVVDWQVMTADDDLDIVAPLAQRMLRVNGVRYPANLHLHEPIAEAATGGSLITGLGGDQVLTCWYQPPAWAGGAWARLHRLGSRTARAAGRPHQARTERPWLRPQVARSVHAAWRQDRMSEPHDPVERLAWRSGRRHLALTRASCAELALAHGVEVHHPLLDKGFLASLAASIPSAGSLTRSELIALVGGDSVPPLVYRRTTKAWFGEVFVGEASRAFAAGWDGSGADADLVDARVLRDLWSTSRFPSGTDLLIQQLWLQQDRATSRVAT